MVSQGRAKILVEESKKLWRESDAQARNLLIAYGKAIRPLEEFLQNVDDRLERPYGFPIGKNLEGQWQKLVTWSMHSKSLGLSRP